MKGNLDRILKFETFFWDGLGFFGFDDTNQGRHQGRQLAMTPSYRDFQFLKIFIQIQRLEGKRVTSHLL